MTGLPVVTSSSDPVDLGAVSERVARADKIIAHAQDNRRQAAERRNVAGQAGENATFERAQTERWLRSVRADRQTRRRDAADRADSLLDGGLADAVPAPRRRRLMLFDADFCMVSDQ